MAMCGAGQAGLGAAGELGLRRYAAGGRHGAGPICRWCPAAGPASVSLEIEAPAGRRARSIRWARATTCRSPRPIARWPRPRAGCRPGPTSGRSIPPWIACSARSDFKPFVLSPRRCPARVFNRDGRNTFTWASRSTRRPSAPSIGGTTWASTGRWWCWPAGSTAATTCGHPDVLPAAPGVRRQRGPGRRRRADQGLRLPVRPARQLPGHVPGRPVLRPAVAQQERPGRGRSMGGNWNGGQAWQVCRRQAGRAGRPARDEPAEDRPAVRPDDLFHRHGVRLAAWSPAKTRPIR